MARWEVGDRNASDQRIWKVTYGQVAEHATTALGEVDLNETARCLSAALEDTYAFSVRMHCDPFSECFRKALDAMSTSVRNGYHTDLTPQGLLAVEADAMLDACQNAWVFGGMGSWNDMGFDGDDGQDYDRVSEQLFAALTNAISVATNSGFRS